MWLPAMTGAIVKVWLAEVAMVLPLWSLVAKSSDDRELFGTRAA